jgi:hypothetical protein
LGGSPGVGRFFCAANGWGRGYFVPHRFAAAGVRYELMPGGPNSFLTSPVGGRSGTKAAVTGGPFWHRG